MDIFARLYNHGIPSGVVAGLILAGWVKPVRLEGVVFLVLCTTLVVWFAWVGVAQVASTVSRRRRSVEHGSAGAPTHGPAATAPPGPDPDVGSTETNVSQIDATAGSSAAPAADPETGAGDTGMTSPARPEDITDGLRPETPETPGVGTDRADASAVRDGQSPKVQDP